MTSATRPRAGWATTPPADPMRLSNDRTVARCSEGMTPLMNAWRSGPSTAKTKAHAASRSRATTKSLVSPSSTSRTTLSTPPMSRALVRRPKRRRTRDTMSPPTIWTPATIAAARPAIP